MILCCKHFILIGWETSARFQCRQALGKMDDDRAMQRAGVWELFKNLLTSCRKLAVSSTLNLADLEFQSGLVGVERVETFAPQESNKNARLPNLCLEGNIQCYLNQLVLHSEPLHMELSQSARVLKGSRSVEVL